MSADDFTMNDPELLRQRWEISHSPQLALQLAEEYRRRDRREDAIGVLEKSLELNPGHLAARMAMGRYRLEIGQKQEACADLEEVVAADPTHLVANKLLVGLYLDLGRDQAARDRLDLYALLNEGDPEIDVLEERWTSSRPAADEPVFDLPAPADGEARLDFMESEPAVLPDFSAPTSSTDPFPGLWIDHTHRIGHDPMGWEDVLPLSSLASTQPAVTESVDQVDEARAETGATVTMAELYRSQGHLDDAESAYRQVLAVDPGNAAALRGLEQLLEPPDSDVTASSLLEGAQLDDRGQEGKKIEMLKRYLQRLRPTSQ